MSNDSHRLCVVRSCFQPADNMSPYSGFALCQDHLGSDLERLNLREAALLKKLDAVANSAEKRSLRLEQQAFQVEMQEIADVFETVQDRLQQWKERLVSSVQQVHDAFGERLKDIENAEHCLNDVRSARTGGKLRNLMEFILSTEAFVDMAVERAINFKSMQENLRNNLMKRDEEDCDDQDSVEEDEGKPSKIVYRCIGDVSSGVQQLQLLIDKHMHSVMQECQDFNSNVESICFSVAQTQSLPGEPRYLALCTNTDGYVSNLNDCVVSLKSPADFSYRKLPVPIIFVALRPSGALYSYLLGISFQARRKYKFLCGKFDWNRAINGLYCDNVRQQLFLAQDHAVTMTDLCGQVIRVVSLGQLGLPAGKISGMSCNGDKVFVLVLGSHQQVHSFSKTSGKLESSLDVSAFGEGNLRKLCLQESKIWLADWKASSVFKVCGITGQLISTARFRSSSVDIMPLHLTSDDSGRLYVSELKHHCVQTISTQDENFELFGTPGSAGIGEDVFNRPADMIVYNAATIGYKVLVVADTNNMRLSAFLLI